MTPTEYSDRHVRLGWWWLLVFAGLGLILETLRRHHGDVLAVSESLGIPKKTLYDKMRRYALSGEEFR